METTLHRLKADRLTQAISLLDLTLDYELVLEGQMHRATHLMNALLHEAGTTNPDDDLIHVDMPRRVVPPSAELAEIMQLLEECELLRCLHVRGPVKPDPRVSAVIRHLEAAFGKSGGIDARR